jgi:hypothetical protein
MTCAVPIAPETAWNNNPVMASDRLLGSLKDSILVKPPYISGTLHLPSSYFSLYYKVAGDGHAARFVNPFQSQSLY